MLLIQLQVNIFAEVGCCWTCCKWK